MRIRKPKRRNFWPRLNGREPARCSCLPPRAFWACRDIWFVRYFAWFGCATAGPWAGLASRERAKGTGFTQILDGRVKTLNPRIYGGILAVRDNPQHLATLQEQRIVPIDLVVCNLYPFEGTLAQPGSTHEAMIENIDIG